MVTRIAFCFVIYSFFCSCTALEAAIITVDLVNFTTAGASGPTDDSSTTPFPYFETDNRTGSSSASVQAGNAKSFSSVRSKTNNMIGSTGGSTGTLIPSGYVNLFALAIVHEYNGPGYVAGGSSGSTAQADVFLTDSVTGHPFNGDYDIVTSSGAGGGNLGGGLLRFGTGAGASGTINAAGTKQLGDSMTVVASARWRVTNGEWTGASPTNPIDPSIINYEETDAFSEEELEDDLEMEVQVPGRISGTLLSAPIGAITAVVVDADYGLNSFVYIDPDPLSAFLFKSSDVNFREFILPTLPNGDSQFDIVFDGQIHSLSSDTVFDFTQHVSGGVERFGILGIDDSEAVDPINGIVAGFKWMNTGDTIWSSHGFSITNDTPTVPEPTTLAIWSLLFGVAFIAHRRKRAS